MNHPGVGGPARCEEAAKRCTALNWTVGPTLTKRRCHMTRKLPAHLCLITLGFLAISSPITAHHGTAGVYDYTHRITTKATVTEYIWHNPHVQIYFTLKNDNGEEQTWGVETVSPGNALANGWTKNSFKVGDELFTPDGWTNVIAIDYMQSGHYTMYDVIATTPYFASGYLDPIHKV